MKQILISIVGCVATLLAVDCCASTALAEPQSYDHGTSNANYSVYAFGRTYPVNGPFTFNSTGPVYGGPYRYPGSPMQYGGPPGTGPSAGFQANYGPQVYNPYRGTINGGAFNPYANNTSTTTYNPYRNNAPTSYNPYTRTFTAGDGSGQ